MIYVDVSEHDIHDGTIAVQSIGFHVPKILMKYLLLKNMKQ